MSQLYILISDNPHIYIYITFRHILQILIPNIYIKCSHEKLMLYTISIYEICP